MKSLHCFSFGLVVVVALSSSCVDMPTDPVVSSIDGAPLNAALMAKLRAADQGCAFSISDPRDRNRIQAMYLHGNRIPFELPKLERNATGGPGSGHSIQFVVSNATIPEPVSVSCWVPANTSKTQLLLLTAQVDWKEMYARLRHADSFNVDELDRGPSREVQQFRHEMIGVGTPAPFEGTRTRGNRAGFAECSINPRQMAAGPVKATTEIITEIICHCVGDPTLDPVSGQPKWSNIWCEFHIGYSQGGTTSTWYQFPEGQPRDPSTVFADLEGGYCGSPGCIDDNSYGYGGMGLSLSGSSKFIDGPSNVTFEANPSGGEVSSVSWQWVSDGVGGGYTTASGYCPIQPDQWNCQMPVNQPGRLELSIEGTNGGGAWAFWQISMAQPGGNGDGEAPEFVPPCSNGRPSNIQPSAGDQFVFALAWCQAEPLDTTKTAHRAAKAKIDSAFTVMRGKSLPICTQMADSLQSLMNNGRFRFIVVPMDTTGHVNLPWGFDGFGQGGSDPYWVMALNTAIAGGVLARNVVTHEGDHVLDQYDPNGVNTDVAGHLRNPSTGKVDKLRTLHSAACGGIP